MYRNQAVLRFWNHLRRLAKSKTWLVRDDGAIRTADDCNCPIVAVYNSLFPFQRSSSQYRSCAATLGLDMTYASYIALAADCPASADPAVVNQRAKLVKALKLA